MVVQGSMNKSILNLCAACTGDYRGSHNCQWVKYIILIFSEAAHSLKYERVNIKLCVYCQSEMWHSNVEMRLNFFVCGESGLSESLGGQGGLLKRCRASYMVSFRISGDLEKAGKCE